MSQIVIVAPHPDDAEIGMGGTIARLAEQGHDVLIVDMTDGCPTPIGDRATRLKEAAEALKHLSPRPGTGKSVRRILLDLKNREVRHTLEARHALAAVYRAHQATIVFCPHPLDAHPDHLAVTRIAEDARFDAKLTGLDLAPPPGLTALGPPLYPKWLIYYYCSHLRRVPDPTFIMDISGYEPRKRASLEAYRSQFIDHAKNRPVLEMIATSDAYFGSRIGTVAGEPFFTHEPLGLTGLDSLA
jgi:LmbE family N-acetylglucosaminyl deacetylase